MMKELKLIDSKKSKVLDLSKHKDRNLLIFFMKELNTFRSAINWVYDVLKEIELI